MDPSFGTLRCTLLDRRSSVRLAAAQIMCLARDEGVRMFEADAQGWFEAALPQGVYDLVISARGYLSLTVRGIGILAGHDQELTRGLVPGQGTSLDSEPATAIGGVVRDRIGQAVGNVLIHVNARDASTAYTTRTDRAGAFVLNGVVPGTYDLVARTADRTLALERVAIPSVRDLVRVDLRLLQL